MTRTGGGGPSVSSHKELDMSISRISTYADPAKPERVSTDHIRRAMIEAIDHCAQFETRPSARAEALAD